MVRLSAAKYPPPLFFLQFWTDSPPSLPSVKELLAFLININKDKSKLKFSNETT